MAEEISGTAKSFLSGGQVARLFGVDTKTVRRWANEGRLAYTQTPGGHLRYEAEYIRRLVKAAYQPETDAADSSE